LKIQTISYIFMGMSLLYGKYKQIGLKFHLSKWYGKNMIWRNRKTSISP